MWFNLSQIGPQNDLFNPEANKLSSNIIIQLKQYYKNHKDFLHFNWGMWEGSCMRKEMGLSWSGWLYGLSWDRHRFEDITTIILKKKVVESNSRYGADLYFSFVWMVGHPTIYIYIGWKIFRYFINLCPNINPWWVSL